MVPELVYELNKIVTMALGADVLLCYGVLANERLWCPSDHLCGGW